MNAATWLNQHLQDWLGVKNAADALTLSVPHNVSSEMGLALLEVADCLRPFPEVVAYLQTVSPEQGPAFLDALLQCEGGRGSRQAIEAYLDKYGMRCVGEIDLARTRWSENPATLIPLLLSNIQNFAPQAGQEKFEQGRQTALQTEQDLLQRLKALPDGEAKAQEAERMIRRLRHFAGYREYPKYHWMQRYFVYKQALLKEAAQLVAEQVLQAPEEIFYLTFDEVHELLRTRQLEPELIEQRQAEYAAYDKLVPPRVITSEGEIFHGQWNQGEIPEGALRGLPVSSGVVEGRARVVLQLEAAEMESGDILVTKFTDPSWTPLFAAVKGLVTEVGGTMTHGSVIAREYGLPAVVSVARATQLIQDGQRIRVHGSEGYVEIITER